MTSIKTNIKLKPILVFKICTENMPSVEALEKLKKDINAHNKEQFGNSIKWIFEYYAYRSFPTVEVSVLNLPEAALNLDDLTPEMITKLKEMGINI